MNGWSELFSDALYDIRERGLFGFIFRLVWLALATVLCVGGAVLVMFMIGCSLMVVAQ